MALLASTALVGLAAPVAAQDATWLASPGTGDFNTNANWSPATVPTGTASFGTSNTTTPTVGDATLSGFTLNAASAALTNQEFCKAGAAGGRRVRRSRASIYRCLSVAEALA